MCIFSLIVCCKFKTMLAKSFKVNSIRCFMQYAKVQYFVIKVLFFIAVSIIYYVLVKSNPCKVLVGLLKRINVLCQLQIFAIRNLLRPLVLRPFVPTLLPLKKLEYLPHLLFI